MNSARLQRFVDDHRYDELLTTVSLAEIAAAWIRYQHAHDGEKPAPSDYRDDDWWAVETWMDERWWSDEARVREGILELVAVARTDVDFGSIGAGVMEVLVTEDLDRTFEGADRLTWLEEAARSSERFRRSLANVYVWGEVADEIAARVEAAAATRLPRPRSYP